MPGMCSHAGERLGMPCHAMPYSCLPVVCVPVTGAAHEQRHVMSSDARLCHAMPWHVACWFMHTEGPRCPIGAPLPAHHSIAQFLPVAEPQEHGQVGGR